MTEIKPRALRIRAAAAYLAMGHKKLRAIIERGEIPVRRGDEDTSAWTVDVCDLDKWADSRKEFLK